MALHSISAWIKKVSNDIRGRNQCIKKVDKTFQACGHADLQDNELKPWLKKDSLVRR
jgi:hypothetical protein